MHTLWRARRTGSSRRCANRKGRSRVGVRPSVCTAVFVSLSSASIFVLSSFVELLVCCVKMCVCVSCASLVNML